MAIRVAFFDCDGTLTTIKSSWEYLHRRLNMWDGNAEHYQALFRAGHIDYHEFCRRDAFLWRGLPVSEAIAILKEIPYQRGAFEVMRALRARGIVTVIVSTGLSLLVEKVAFDLSVDMALSNRLAVENGFLTGEIMVSVDYNEKGVIVESMLRNLGASRAEACAVGDGNGDLGMFEAVGLPVGFHPHPKVAKVVQASIWSGSLLDMVPIIDGYGPSKG